jgi:hypothetical protein
MVVYHNLAGNARILFEYAKFIFVGFIIKYPPVHRKLQAGGY